MRIFAAAYSSTIVAIEMVGRQIQQHADFRPERLDRFKLKTADLGYRHRRIGRSLDQREQRHADVSPIRVVDLRAS